MKKRHPHVSPTTITNYISPLNNITTTTTTVKHYELPNGHEVYAVRGEFTSARTDTLTEYEVHLPTHAAIPGHEDQPVLDCLSPTLLQALLRYIAALPDYIDTTELGYHQELEVRQGHRLRPRWNGGTL